MNVAVIGCGLIGKKRAKALPSTDQLIACLDSNPAAAESFGKEFGCPSFATLESLLAAVTPEICVVAVVNKFAAPLVNELLRRGIHVLAEKPLGRTTAEAKLMLAARDSARTTAGRPPVLKTGFNHRFHPALWRAKELAEAGAIGKILWIRARYGHGARPGMEQEWRSSKDLCGGGELLDQGVHIIDLVRWFGGDIREVYGKAATLFWNIGVEDNAFVTATTENGVTAQFHVSWSNWKNIFSFEIAGATGYLRIEGLGGSYGPESLEIGKRNPEGGRPTVELVEYPSEDISWSKEWENFSSAIETGREPIGSGLDGWKANEVIEAIYRSSGANAPAAVQSSVTNP